MIYKTLQRKLKIEQHQPYYKTWQIWCWSPNGSIAVQNPILSQMVQSPSKSQNDSIALQIPIWSQMVQSPPKSQSYPKWFQTLTYTTCKHLQCAYMRFEKVSVVSTQNYTNICDYHLSMLSLIFEINCDIRIQNVGKFLYYIRISNMYVNQ
jgi:hypothetical protein